MNWIQKLKELKNKQETLLTAVKAENRAFTAAEQTAFDDASAEIKNVVKMIDNEKQVEGLSKDLDTPVDQTNPRITVKEPTNKFGFFGEFLDAVRKSAAAGRVVDNRLVEVQNASGLNEGVGSEGGFLVSTEHSTQLLTRTYESGALTSRVKMMSMGGNSNGMTINAVKETSRATGSRWGGVNSYWLDEAGEKIGSKPSFRKMELKLKKLIGLCYATDELLQDASAMDSIITQAFSDEFAWQFDEVIFNGDGVGKPLGILNGGSLVTVAKETNQGSKTILAQNIHKMWSRMIASSRKNAVWFINQDIEPELFSMGIATANGVIPVYLPANGIAGQPYGTLMGRPVIPIEQAKTVGTVGDIVLADMSDYLWIDKAGIKKDTSIHVRFNYDEQVFRFVVRVDGQPILNSPITPANGTNTLSPFVALATRA